VAGSHIGTRIAELRKRRGWKQQVLADQLGISREYLSMIEHGKRKLTKLPLLAAIAKALGVDAWRLMVRPEDPAVPTDEKSVLLDLRDIQATLVEGEAHDPVLVLNDGYTKVELSGGLRGVSPEAEAGARRLMEAAYWYTQAGPAD
jgi:transcriptional regulator with XRE-family HTH domain